MFSNHFFDIILDLGEDWKVSDVSLNSVTEEVDITVEYISTKAECSESLEMCNVYDYRPTRRWRHLDILQYKTFINCKVPRIKSDKGIKSISIPWAGDYERHTYLFERYIINLLLATKNQTKTSKLARCGFNVVNRVIHNASKRGMERRSNEVVLSDYSLDEKSFKKGHNYVSVLSSPTLGCILDIEEGRDKEATKKLIEKVIPIDRRESVETLTIDMWKAYLTTAQELLPNAKIIHDRYHLITYLNKAIDQVRRREVKEHKELKNSRYALLKNKANLTDKQHIIFKQIQDANYEVSRAWRVREDFKGIFNSASTKDALGLFLKWSSSVLQTRIKEVIKVGKMFNNHLSGVINAMTHSQSNGMAERLNGKIQEIKTIGRGYRKFENFRSAILFFHGGLSLYPHNSW